MTDIISKSKRLTDEINQLSQQEQVIRGRINAYKRLIEDKKAHAEIVANLMKEEAELMKELEGV